MMDIGPLRIREEMQGFGDVTWYFSWSWSRMARNKALSEVYTKLHEEARMLINAGDQFDRGGDIYSKAGYFLAAAEIVQGMKS